MSATARNPFFHAAGECRKILRKNLLFIIVGGTRCNSHWHGFVGASVKPPIPQAWLGFNLRYVVQTSCMDFGRLAMAYDGMGAAILATINLALRKLEKRQEPTGDLGDPYFVWKWKQVRPGLVRQGHIGMAQGNGSAPGGVAHFMARLEYDVSKLFLQRLNPRGGPGLWVGSQADDGEQVRDRFRAELVPNRVQDPAVVRQRIGRLLAIINTACLRISSIFFSF